MRGTLAFLLIGLATGFSAADNKPAIVLLKPGQRAYTIGKLDKVEGGKPQAGVDAKVIFVGADKEYAVIARVRVLAVDSPKNPAAGPLITVALTQDQVKIMQAAEANGKVKLQLLPAN